MPLNISHLNASLDMRERFRWEFEAERIFRFTQDPIDFISDGIISNDQFTSVLDGDPILRRFNNMTINEGHTVTPTQRCKGMYLLIEGDLTVNGTLSMSARGANALGKFVGIDPYGESIYFHDTDLFSMYGLPTILKYGSMGGPSVQTYTSGDGKYNLKPGVSGESLENSLGGGGSGGSYSSHGGTCHSGAGAQATSFSGGAGGGGTGCIDTGGSGYAGAANGGKGGDGRRIGTVGDMVRGMGGGAGNPGGARSVANGGTASAGVLGTGGLMILIVKGNIIFGPNGKIESKGSNGGNGATCGGGGSGGGAIYLFTKYSDIDLSKLDVSGGFGGVSGNSPGGPGGAGTRQIYTI